MPRRSAVASGIRHEQLVLPALAHRLQNLRAAVPEPILAGQPDATFPWPWSVVPWHDGTPGIDVPRAERRGWARDLAGALAVIHRPAPAALPRNPYRGGPLTERAASLEARLSGLRALPHVPPATVAILARRWSEGLAAPPWIGPGVIIHGDLHPGNLVSYAGTLAAIIDFIDVAPGDPAYDLAVAWLAFDDRGRRDFIAATGDRYAAATWLRARAWAAAISIILLDQSDDMPTYRDLALETAEELRQ
jgi:aminoglycoside phosphotransferase (APT) family kinase protein